MAILDEALFAIPGLLDFTAELIQHSPARLQLKVYSPAVAMADFQKTLLSALGSVPALHEACEEGTLCIHLLQLDQPLPMTGAKRKIEVRTEQ